jgi:hypothetical protein
MLVALFDATSATGAQTGQLSIPVMVAELAHDP